MVVVDVNVLAYSLIAGDRTGEALEVQRADPDWRLPPVWRHEFANVLVTYVRQGGMAEQRARELYEAAVASYGPREIAPDGAATIRCAIGRRLSAYDAQYVALAQQLDVSCVTEDAGIQRAVPACACSMRDFIRKHPARPSQNG
jgi:predicted nucleic acid-binding protein